MIYLISVVIYVAVIGVDGRIDWSTRELTQQWFNGFSNVFGAIVESGESFKDLMVDYADNVIDCNPSRCYDNKYELINDLDNAFKLISEFSSYFDVVVWSRTQVISNIVYTHKGINGKSLVFRATLLSKLNDEGKIAYWIYTADQSMLDEVKAFWDEL
eukprot:503063_1